METQYIPKGTTEPIDFQLDNDDGVALNGSGMVLSYELTDKSGAAVTLVGTVAWLSAPAGTARVSLDASDLPVASSPYLLRFAVIDAVGKVGYWPNGEHSICLRVVETQAIVTSPEGVCSSMVNILRRVTPVEAVTAGFDFSTVVQAALDAGEAIYFPDRWNASGPGAGNRLAYNMGNIDPPSDARIHVEQNQNIQSTTAGSAGQIFDVTGSGLEGIHISGGIWEACHVVFKQSNAAATISSSLFEDMRFRTCIDGFRFDGGSVGNTFRNIRGYSTVACLFRAKGVVQSNLNTFDRFTGTSMAINLLASHATQIATDGLLVGGIVFHDDNGGSFIYVSNQIIRPWFEGCSLEVAPIFTPIIANGYQWQLSIRDGYFEDNRGLQDILMNTDSTTSPNATTRESKAVTIDRNVFAQVSTPAVPMTARVRLVGRHQIKFEANQLVAGDGTVNVLCEVDLNLAVQNLAYREFDANWIQADVSPPATYFDALVRFIGTTAGVTPWPTVNYRWRAIWGGSVSADGDMRWVENDWNNPS